MMSDKSISAMIAHAARDFPSEACGLIVDSGAGLQVIECENIHHDPERSFMIDPMTYAQHVAHVVAVYHSHPNRSPKPSEADIASSERCAKPFIIIGYPNEEIYTYRPVGAIPAPYEGRGFVYGIMDCLSLVSDYYRHELGIALNDGERKHWGWWKLPQHSHDFVNGFKDRGFVEVDSPAKNDIVVMQLQGICPNHAAIYLGNSVILHHPGQNNLSRQEMYGHYWRNNTICYLRHKSRVGHEED